MFQRQMEQTQAEMAAKGCDLNMEGCKEERR